MLKQQLNVFKGDESIASKGFVGFKMAKYVGTYVKNRT
jgi:hypothetical protein